MLNKQILLLIASLALAACVTNPLSRTSAESSKPLTVKGFAAAAGQLVTLQAVDQNTGALAPLGTTNAAMSGSSYTTSTGMKYTLYPWTYNAGVIAPNFWSPQTVVADVATAQGHLEIVTSANGNVFDTFSAEAAKSALASGKDPAAAGNARSRSRG